MLRHRTLHERPEVKPRMLVKGPASSEPGSSNSPAKIRRIHSPLPSNSPSVEPNIFPEDPETRILYIRHWNTIQTQENSGNRVQDRYNFTLNDITSSTFLDMVRNIFTQQTSAFRINVSFVFILTKSKLANYGTTIRVKTTPVFFDVPHLINKFVDLKIILDTDHHVHPQT